MVLGTIDLLYNLPLWNWLSHENSACTSITVIAVYRYKPIHDYQWADSLSQGHHSSWKTLGRSNEHLTSSHLLNWGQGLSQAVKRLKWLTNGFSQLTYLLRDWMRGLWNYMKVYRYKLTTLSSQILRLSNRSMENVLPLRFKYQMDCMFERLSLQRQ